MTALLVLYFHQLQAYVSLSGLLCRLFLIMNVEASAHITFKGSIWCVTWRAVVSNPAVLTGVMSQTVLHLEWLTSIEAVDVDLQAAIKVLGMDILRPAVARFLLQSSPDEVQPSFVEVIAKLIGSSHPNHDRRGIRDCAIPLFAFPQSELRLLTLCDVMRDGELHHTAIGVMQRRGMGFHVVPRTIQRDDVKLQGVLVTTADALVKASKLFVIFRSDQVIDTLADYRFPVLRPDHRKAC